MWDRNGGVIMTKEEIIYQLDSLQYHCADMAKDAINNIWNKDVEALEIAIEIIKKEMK